MKLFYYSKGHKFKIFLVIILIFLISLTQSFFPFINKILIDDVFGEGQFNLLPKLIFGIALAAIIYFALNIAKQLIITFISQKITIEIKNDLISQIRELSFSEYNKKSIG
ncbi:ABC transporter transmembrane domain-containing protein, partial [Neobacillus drentensis]